MGIATPASTLTQLAATPMVSQPAAAVDYTKRPGWILLEHFGANAPDGSGHDEAPDGRSLWLIRADGTELHELAPGLPVDGKTNPVWSRDGTHIAFESVYPRSVVFEADLAGYHAFEVGQHDADCLVEGAAPCFERSPTYSPNADQLATVTSGWQSAAGDVIYLRSRITDAPGMSCSTVEAAFSCLFHLGFGLDATEVDASARIEGLNWSPDGTRIAYYVVAKDADNKPTGSSELWIIDPTFHAEDPEPHRIPLPEGLTAGDPDWSPDSSLLVFSSEPIHDWNDVGVPDHPDVYTVRPDGSDLQRLTHDGGSGSPTWTSDGKILFYSQRAMWLMDADGSNASPVYPDGPTLWGEDTGWSYYGYWQPIP
ncbi:MAG: hypothetical protein ABIP53_09315 [Candidatus Limnocylindrales bacterium]